MKKALILSLFLMGCGDDQKTGDIITDKTLAQEAFYNCVVQMDSKAIQVNFQKFCSVKNRECALVVIRSMQMQCLSRTYLEMGL